MTRWSWMLAATVILGLVMYMVNSKPSYGPPILLAPDQSLQWKESVVVNVDATASKLPLPPAENSEIKTYSAVPTVNSVLKTLGAGDTVWFTVDKDKTDSITHLALKQATIGLAGSIGAMLLAFSVIWSIILMVTKGHPWSFALGLDLRLSNSQTQLYLWFLALATIYLAEIGLRGLHTPYFGGIGVPARLLALSGVSALTFGAARANTTIKAALAPDGAKGPADPGRSRWEHLKDLFTNDQGKPDLGDFQMIALSGVAILVYLVLSASFLGSLAFASHVDLPPVDDSLLGGAATAQGAYLLKKIGSRLGN